MSSDMLPDESVAQYIARRVKEIAEEQRKSDPYLSRGWWHTDSVAKHLWVCPECSALVLASSRDDHDNYHRKYIDDGK